MDNNNRLHIRLWDIQFYKVDESGNELTNKDGSVKLFTTKHDFPHHLIAELPEHEDLEEVENENNADKRTAMYYDNDGTNIWKRK